MVNGTLRGPWALLALIAVCCAGCSSFDLRRSTQDAYEQARRDVEGTPLSGRHESYGPQKKDLEFEDFAPENLADTFKRMSGQGPEPAAAEQTYRAAEQTYQAARKVLAGEQQGNPQELFENAADQYRRAADQWPNSTLEHYSLFMLGESLFFADRYPEAEEAFAELLKKYPNSRYLDKMQGRRFQIALYWLQLDDADHQSFYEFNVTNSERPTRDTFGHAVRVLDRIRLDDPTGALADDATLALGNAFFRRGKFIRADEYYTDLRKTFPSSDHQFDAHFLGLKAKLESYQGHDYSAVSLREAQKLLKQLRRQFPAEAAKESEALDLAEREVRFHLAERDWQLAQHHDRRQEFGAAKFYYDAVVQDFRDTPFGARSETRLAQIGGLPNEPSQPLQWLVDMFPDEDQAVPLIASEPSNTANPLR